ncbi:NAD(P)-dependent oxidoreductase [Gottfriedia sp. NPDC056225]|uniref:NAD(P)-dependent oxidoreductase n=1 Tax=Gottfriedia sp. NPDC056225 TaxID=3345751 RepID=UPI0015587444|nr:NAD(P)-dependent oxidoreductase [Arthrobacter citreus]
MKIGIIGATGKAGSLIMSEAIERGHEVTAIVRDASKLTNKTISVLEKDLFDLNSTDLKQFDVVVNAFKAANGQEHLYLEAGNVLINALKNAETRLIVVGGAGSLFVDEEQKIQLVDTPEFPKEYYATASKMTKGLQDLQKTTDVNWTFISPAAFFDPNGKRTGAYQKGKDNFIVNKKGDSYVSYADYAIALVDEIENPQHLNERFTLVSEAE